MHCLQAHPCIFLPGNFTGWGSEGVKTVSKMLHQHAAWDVLSQFGSTLLLRPFSLLLPALCYSDPLTCNHSGIRLIRSQCVSVMTPGGVSVMASVQPDMNPYAGSHRGQTQERSGYLLIFIFLFLFGLVTLHKFPATHKKPAK